MFPFDIPNVFRSILTGDSWSTKTTDTDTKVTVSCKGLFYWHFGIFISLMITVNIGNLHLVSLLEMRLSGNRYVGSNPTISATNACKHCVCGHFYFSRNCSVKNLSLHGFGVHASFFSFFKSAESPFLLASQGLEKSESGSSKCRSIARDDVILAEKSR